LKAFITLKFLIAFFYSHFPVVNQFYQSRVIDEFVLQGNAATMKCSIPSFVADFVYVDAWFADDDEEFAMGSDKYGTPSSHTTSASPTSEFPKSNCN
jgi:hypothetical protein